MESTETEKGLEKNVRKTSLEPSKDKNCIYLKNDDIGKGTKKDVCTYSGNPGCVYYRLFMECIKGSNFHICSVNDDYLKIKGGTA